MLLTVLSMFCKLITGGDTVGGSGNDAPRLGGTTILSSQFVSENGSNAAARRTSAVSWMAGAGACGGGAVTLGAAAMALAVMMAAAAIAVLFARALIFYPPRTRSAGDWFPRHPGGRHGEV